MSSFSPSNHNSQYSAITYALEKLLPEELYNNKTHFVTSLQNLKPSSAFCNNYNNSYIPLEIDNLPALYAYYQIDPQIYPPPDLQFYNTIKQAFNFSYPYLQSTVLQNNSFFEQQGNSNERSQNWRKKQKQLDNNYFHYRNMITVRRISCHDMLDSKIIMNKQLKYHQTNLENQKIKKDWNKKTKSTNLMNNKSQKYKTFSTEFNSSPPFIELHTSPTQSTTNKLLISPSITNSTKNTLTNPSSNVIFQQKEFENKILNSMSTSGLKFTSLRDSSASSLTSTQLVTNNYDQTKPNANTTNTIISDSQIDFGSLADNLSHPSPTTSSIVPHFSSTIAPHVPFHASSSTTAIPNIVKTESIVTSTLTNENIQSLIDQLKNCITTLSHLLENKIEDKKHKITNVKSYSGKKRNKTKKKPIQLFSSSSSSSPSLTSTSNHCRFSKTSISKTNNLVFEDITVRRCNSFNNQDQKKHQSNTSPSYNDQHEELKRCLLVYYRNRTSKNRDKNINSNEMHWQSHCTRNDLMLNQHLLSSSSQSSQSLSNDSIENLSISKTNLILAEEDDEYESFNKLSINTISLK